MRSIRFYSLGMMTALLVVLFGCGPSKQVIGEGEVSNVKALIKEQPDDQTAVQRATPGTTAKVSGTTRYNRALQFRNSGDDRAALREAEKCVAEYPKFKNAWYLKGLSHLKLGENDKAVESFKRLIEIDSGYVEGYYSLGKAYAAGKDYKKAAEAMKRASELESSPPHLAAYGNMLALAGDLEEAEKPLREAIKADPKNGDIRRNLASVMLKGEKWAEAEKEYAALKQANPKDGRVAFNHAYCLEKQGKTKEAIAAYRQSVESNPKNAASLLNMGILYAKQGDKREAIEAFENFLQILPEGEESVKVRDQIAILKESQSSDRS